MASPRQSSATIDGFPAAPAVEGMLIALVQGGLVALLGAGLVMPALTALIPTVILSVRWADPLMLDLRDAAVVVGFTAFLLAPMIGIYGLEYWGAQLLFTMAGIVVGRIQLLPAPTPSDAVGVEAHLLQVRKEGNVRPTGNADRAPATGGLDPIGGLLGGGGTAAAPPMEDPYENSRALQYDPEDR